ncbi:hypothetical protein [Zestomonas thermotolerans]|uniref:hypothetical protein n=1 Tax=Zestomonas thermotolerans TaxID=157784 RepID=UPI0023F49CED|nr:hypothetical protein [Pseudomonas thermotolerans]
MIRKLTVLSLAILLTTGCATGLNSAQTTEYRSMEANGLAVQEKNPTTGALLGLLPGGGSFYAREPAFGVLNLLFWPLSVLWDPMSGYDGSMAINYQASKAHIRKSKLAEEKKLQRDFQDGLIDNATYARGMRDIEDKYTY